MPCALVQFSGLDVSGPKGLLHCFDQVVHVLIVERDGVAST
jgi:hypothetical protein